MSHTIESGHHENKQTTSIETAEDEMNDRGKMQKQLPLVVEEPKREEHVEVRVSGNSQLADVWREATMTTQRLGKNTTHPGNKLPYHNPQIRLHRASGSNISLGIRGVDTGKGNSTNYHRCEIQGDGDKHRGNITKRTHVRHLSWISHILPIRESTKINVYVQKGRGPPY